MRLLEQSWITQKDVMEGSSAIASGVLTMVSNLGLMATAGYLIASAALRPDTILLLWVPIVLVRFFGLSRGAFRYIERLLSHDVTFRILTRLRTRFFERLEPLFPLPIAQHKLGDLLQSNVKDIDLLQNVFLRVISPVIVALLTSIVAIGIVSYYGDVYGFILTACLTLSGLLLSFIAYYKSRKVSAMWVRQKASLTSSIVDTIAGTADILAFGREEDWTEDVVGQIQSVEQLEQKSTRLDSYLNAIAITMPGLAAWLMMVVGAEAVWQHHLSGIALTVLTLTALTAFESLQSLPSAFIHLGEYKQAWKRVNQLVSLTRGHRDIRSELELDVCARSSQSLQYHATCGGPVKSPAIEIDNLYFGYGDGQTSVLKDVTFRIPGGHRCAIVGSNGSGKSTLVNLIAGLYRYESGSIRIDGIQVSEWNAASIREQSSIVSQSTYIFSATLLDNLRLGAPVARIEDVERVVQLVGLTDLAKRLPNGLSTWVGDGFISLSGGERQRIGIARVALRNTGLVILDEATEGLDAVSEREIITMLNNVFKGKTMLFITHRLMALPEMDSIIVMDKGRVLEVGTHAHLVEKRGVYAELWNMGNVMINPS